MITRWLGEGGITYRAAMAAVAAFGTCLLLGPNAIAWLRRRRLGDPVAKNESARLDRILAGKKDTPTMGGTFLVAAVLVGIALLASPRSPSIPVVAMAAVLLVGLGGVDDWRKLRRQGGLTMATKLLVQCAVGLGLGIAVTLVLLESSPETATSIVLPGIGPVADLGPWFPLYAMLVVVACSNAVNITDGLDGLAPGCLAISFLAYGILSYVVGRVDWSEYLGIPYVPAAAELTVVCAAIFGAAMGFLWFNAHPAQVFMGDSGSQPLGGVLAVVALLTKQEILLAWVGGIFVIEAGSSLLQILSYKLARRRVFLIAPLHHHFQFQGTPEPRIVLRFWIVAAILAISSLATLKLG